MIKIIAIGNILLGDDGIAIKVTQAMKQVFLGGNEEIAVIIGETDFNYCLENIEPKDFVIIIDSTYFGLEPGSVTTMTLEDCDKYLRSTITAHGDSLINILRREYRHIKGYLVGVEVAGVDFSLELSSILQEKFQEICLRVSGEIQELVSEYLKSS